MLIGVLLLVIALLAVFVGTKESEASVLYYDADFEPAEQEQAATEIQSDDFVGDGLNAEQPVVVQEEKPAASKPGRKQAPAAGIEEIRQAASENDPNAAAQALFDSLKGGQW